MIKQLSQLLVSNESLSDQKQAAYLAERITCLIIKCSQDDSFGTRVQQMPVNCSEQEQQVVYENMETFSEFPTHRQAAEEAHDNSPMLLEQNNMPLQQFNTVDNRQVPLRQVPEMDYYQDEGIEEQVHIQPYSRSATVSKAVSNQKFVSHDNSANKMEFEIPVRERKLKGVIQKLESQFSQVLRNNPLPELVAAGTKPGDLPTWEMALADLERSGATNLG